MEKDWEGILTAGEIRDQNLWRQYAVCGDLGGTVERMLFGSSDHCKADKDNIQRILLTFVESEKNRAEFMAQLPQLVNRVTQHAGFLDAVKTLAQELLKAKRLDSQEIRNTIGRVINSNDLITM